MTSKKIAIIIDPHLSERNPRCRTDNFLETALQKLEYVARSNDYVIIAGDIFHICSNSTLLFNKVYSFFKKYRGKFHAIPGNHDVFHRNLGALDKTTIGSLYYTDVLELHTDEPWELEGITFVPVPINVPANLIPTDDTNSKVLIAHKFYNNEFDPDESLSEDDIDELNYKVAFLGHDHKPYDEDYIGNTALIRMGSLTRIDTQSYNKDRDICFYQLETLGDGKFEYYRHTIPCKPVEEVYSEEAINHMSSTEKKKEMVSFIQIGSVLEKLTKKRSDQAGGINSLDATLRRLKTPESSIADIKWRHELNNVTYT